MSDGYSWYVLIACHIYQQLHFLVVNRHCYVTSPVSSYKRGNQFHNYNSMIVIKFWVSVRTIVFIWFLTDIFSCKYHHYQSFNYDMAICATCQKHNDKVQSARMQDLYRLFTSKFPKLKPFSQTKFLPMDKGKCKQCMHDLTVGNLPHVADSRPVYTRSGNSFKLNKFVFSF